MRGLMMALALGLVATQATADSTPRQDALVDRYFSIWDQDSNVTLANVEKLYASRITYYGQPMTPESLYRDKRAFIRRWPERRYSVEPGSAARVCDAGESRCRLTAILDWRTSGESGTRAGRSRVTLTLVEEDGALKIAREGAVTLGR